MGEWSADLQPARVARLEEVLRQVPDNYQNKPRLREDVSGLLRSVTTLQAQLQTFEGGGRRVTLFYLYGVLPIVYHDSKYHIPVTMYFDPPYPRQPPRCFVTPTSGMELKASHPQVDRGGLIHIAYLNDWNEHSSSLQELANVLTQCFTARPPVQSTAGRGSSASRQPSAARRSSSKTPPGPEPQPRRPVEPCDSQLPLLGGLSQSLGVLFDGLAGAMERVAPGSAPADPAPVPPVLPSSELKSFKLPKYGQQAEDPADRGSAAPSSAVRQRSFGPSRRQAAAGSGGLAGSVERDTGRVERELRGAEAALRAFAAKSVGRELDPEQPRPDADPDCLQLLELLAEERAIEEHLVALDELLAARRLPLELFLAEVRELGRRQFMCRCQRQKIAAAIAADADSVGTRRVLNMGA